jgi:hypothetical protein
MKANSRERSEAIQAEARALLVERAIDVTQQVDCRTLSKELKARAACDISTAKRHIGTAVRRARGGQLPDGTWGGRREGAGRPKAETTDD